MFEQIKDGHVVYFPDSYYNVHHVDPTFPDVSVWIKAVGFTLNDNDGKPDRIVLMHENITERKHAEAMFHDIIDKNPLSIQIVDKEGYTVHGNPACMQLFGMLPPPEFSIFADLEQKSAELQNIIARAKNGEVVHMPDLYYNPRDASPDYPDVPLWIRALLFPLNDSNGKPERFVLMHENITERKHFEQALLKAKEKAEESDRLKSAFLANMSHEIRTPMNGILGFAELLKEPELTGEQQQEYIKIIEKSGARMLNIINDIIDISKIEAGLMKVELKESNINEQLEYIYTFFRPEVQSKGLQQFIHTTLPVNEAIVYTDREKLYAILTNLVKNAVKYTNQGSIVIGYTLKPVVEPVKSTCTNQLEFFVRDTGIGIAKDRQEAIFERFVQADIEDAMARQGAGLGLAITKSYVEMLGGKIWVDSEEGNGSCFYFTLPYNPKHDQKEVLIKDANPCTGNHIKNLNILIAEDDEASEMLCGIMMASFARQILKVKTGTEAVEACRNNPDTDLILMDIQMPVMSGYEAARQIRQFNQEVFIIAQTAYGLAGDREKAMEAGCNEYIPKPVNRKLLIEIIANHFAQDFK